MNISVEISMYPLNPEYIPHIDKFLEKLHNTAGIEVQTNVMSTQIFGPMESVFPTLQEGIKEAYQDLGQCPFVIKVLKDDVSGTPIKEYKE